MVGYNYETHVMENKLLPFIFHTDDVARMDAFPNWHENIEILCCISGEGWIRCDTKTYRMCPGDIVVINSNTLHASVSEHQLIYHCLIIDEAFFLSNGIPISSIRFQEFLQDSTLFYAFEQIVSAFSGRKTNDCFYQAALIRHSIMEFVLLLCKNYVLVNQNADIPASLPAERVKKVMLYIRKHLSNPISLDDLSQHVGISKYYLSREFRSFTGKTIVDTINMLRCLEARRLILNGTTVSEAAAASGFENLSYFSRTFKKHIGKLPSKYSVKSEVPCH